MSNSALSLLETYFQENLSSLQHHYPGINFKKFLLEYEQFISEKAHLQQVLNLEFIRYIQEGVPFEYINQERFFFKNHFFIIFSSFDRVF